MKKNKNNNINSDCEKRLENHREMVGRWQKKYKQDILKKQEESLLKSYSYEPGEIRFSVLTSAIFDLNPVEAFRYIESDKMAYKRFVGVTEVREERLILQKIIYSPRDGSWVATFSYNPN